MLRTVPWSSWTEWEETVTSLLNLATALAKVDSHENISELVWASKRVAAWETRQCLPHSVASLQAVADSLHLSRLKECPPQAVILSLSSTLIRFVNGLLDKLQRSVSVIPLRSLASKVSLPSPLVEGRHTVAHSHMLSQQALVAHCVNVIEYIRLNYVFPQRVCVNQMQSYIINVLVCYRNTIRTIRTVKDKTNSDKEQMKTLKQLQKKTIKEIIQYCTSPQKTITEVNSLLNCGFLVPKTKTPKAYETIPTLLYEMWFPLLTEMVMKVSSFSPIFLSIVAHKIITNETQTEQPNELTGMLYDEKSIEIRYETSLLFLWYKTFVLLVNEKCESILKKNKRFSETIRSVLSFCCPGKSSMIDLVFETTLCLLAPNHRTKYVELRERMKNDYANRTHSFVENSKKFVDNQNQNPNPNLPQILSQQNTQTQLCEIVYIPHTLPFGLCVDGTFPDLTLPHSLDCNDCNCFCLNDKSDSVNCSQLQSTAVTQTTQKECSEVNQSKESKESKENIINKVTKKRKRNNSCEDKKAEESFNRFQDLF